MDAVEVDGLPITASLSEQAKLRLVSVLEERTFAKDEDILAQACAHALKQTCNHITMGNTFE
jgi:hypothetical protein